VRTSGSKNRKRVLIAGALLAALILLASATLIGTGAVFASSSADPENVFTAGELTMVNSKGGAAILSMELMRPGDSVGGDVTIENKGDIAGDFSLDMQAIADFSGADAGAGGGADADGRAGLAIEATSGDGAVVTFSATAADDVDGSVPVTFSPTSGSTFPIGTTTVTYSAVDSTGNKSTGTFTVTVVAGAES
jgi:hypothetical protein